MSSGLLPPILVAIGSIVIVVALFTIMWYFQTGGLTSIPTAFVAWLHVGMIGLVLLWDRNGRVYASPAELESTLTAIVCGAVIAAVIHGTIVAGRNGRLW
jgi:hypothetical protein